MMRGLEYPPLWYVSAMKKALNKKGTWDVVLEMLCAFYKIRVVKAYFRESSVPEGADACYVPFDEVIYTRKKRCSEGLVFHEFGHHLEKCKFGDRFNYGLAKSDEDKVKKCCSESIAESFSEGLCKLWEKC